MIDRETPFESTHGEVSIPKSFKGELILEIFLLSSTGTVQIYQNWMQEIVLIKTWTFLRWLKWLGASDFQRRRKHQGMKLKQS